MISKTVYILGILSTLLTCLAAESNTVISGANSAIEMDSVKEFVGKLKDSFSATVLRDWAGPLLRDKKYDDKVIPTNDWPSCFMKNTNSLGSPKIVAKVIAHKSGHSYIIVSFDQHFWKKGILIKERKKKLDPACGTIFLKWEDDIYFCIDEETHEIHKTNEIRIKNEVNNSQYETQNNDSKPKLNRNLQ
jgi:hypothetical protein